MTVRFIIENFKINTWFMVMVGTIGALSLSMMNTPKPSENNIQLDYSYHTLTFKYFGDRHRCIRNVSTVRKKGDLWLVGPHCDPVGSYCMMFISFPHCIRANLCAAVGSFLLWAIPLKIFIGCSCLGNFFTMKYVGMDLHLWLQLLLAGLL